MMDLFKVEQLHNQITSTDTQSAIEAGYSEKPVRNIALLCEGTYEENLLRNTELVITLKKERGGIGECAFG